MLKLFDLLKPNGHLICEEGDVAKTYCVNINDPLTKVDNLALNKWLKVTFDIGDKFSYDFELGSKINSIMEKITNQATSVSVFQPTLETTYHKQSLSFAIPAIETFLLKQELMDQSSIDTLAKGLEELAEDNTTYLKFIANTLVDVQKCD